MPHHSVDQLKEWISPSIPLGLMFGKKQQALEILEQIKQQLKSIDIMQEQLNQAEQELPELKKQLEQAQQKLEQLQRNLSESELRQTLIADLLSANNLNPGVRQYFQLLGGEFLEFANQEDSLKDEAAAFLELQAIGDELKVIGAYPEFYKKRSIAIAGGFSAGKSEFISSLFEDPNIRLPIGIEPTTAIPTYALNGQENGVIGCSQNGGVIDLLKIDPDFQQKLSHNFIRSFGFNLKTIMPFVFMTTPMKLEHLCFIDTPGYNPSDVADGHTAEDVKTAQEFVQNSEALLWLIGLDSNGTISKSDLDFLDHAGQYSQKLLYIVLNKADLRPYDQLEEIMAEIADTLDDYDIEIAGISAYSSITKEEYLYHKQSLHAFLASLDQPSEKQTLLMRRLFAVDEKYQRAILRTIKENKQINATLSGFKLDLLENGFDDLSSDLYEKLSKMNSIFTIKQKEEHLKQLETVTMKIVAAIEQVFGQPSKVKRKNWTQDEIELDEKFVRLTQEEQMPDELMDEQPSNEKETLSARFWGYWRNRLIGSNSKIELTVSMLLFDNKETFTFDEWKDVYNNYFTHVHQNYSCDDALNALCEAGIIRCIDDGSKKNEFGFGNMLYSLFVESNPIKTYQFVLPDKEIFNQFLQRHNNINLSDEQLKAIKALIESQHYFDFEDWTKNYNGDFPVLTLERLINAGVIRKENEDYYSFV
ncbi:dynamin family protein [Neisseria subflava]|uniref:dynamin family protein n=1 Tax=Neisseria subflava TaxID=28449 RepID=UPI0016607406|nr:dynamin family protein [Neisseria sp. KH1003-01]